MRDTGGSEPCERAARVTLPVLDGVDQDEVAKAYAAAVPRVAAELRMRFVIADLTVLVLLIFLARIAVGLIQSVPASSPSWAVLVATTAYGLVIISGGVLVARSAGSLRATPHAVDLTAEKAGPRVLTFMTTRVLHTALVMTVVITGLVTPVDEWEALWFNLGFDAFRRAAGFSSNLVVFFAVLALAELYVLMLRYAAQERRAGRPRPLDRVATRLVVVAAEVRWCAERPHQVRNREVRSLVGALEKTAREAERFPLFSVSWHDRAGRREAGVDGARLAEVIRAHKAPLMTAISAADFAHVARSLTGGVGAWARGDLATMVRDAPDVVIPSRTWLVRLGPAFVLAVLGVVLPLLPPLNEVTEAAAAARASLLAGALMAVVTGSIQAPEYVRTVLGKTVLE